MLPAAPSPLPVDKIGRLGIACPAGSQAQSFDGGPVTVHFAAPVASGGQQPVTVGCTPHSGSAFSIGSTDVTCGASDALQQTASCAFRVTVRGTPKLAVSRFLAFGDSITAGVVSPPTGGTRLDSFNAYPSRLQRGLTSRYVTQDIRVINAGLPGEEAADAVGRFNAELRRQRPQVVLLMEGTNDLYAVGAAFENAVNALDSMVLAARVAGADTFLMTIPPQRGHSYAHLVPSFNSRIRSIAARRGAVLFDVYSVLFNGRCGGVGPIPCIGNDGLHPTAEGYRLIADELSRSIVARYDMEVLPTAASEQSDAATGSAFPEGVGLFSRRRLR